MEFLFLFITQKDLQRIYCFWKYYRNDLFLTKIKENILGIVLEIDKKRIKIVMIRQLSYFIWNLWFWKIGFKILKKKNYSFLFWVLKPFGKKITISKFIQFLFIELLNHIEINMKQFYSCIEVYIAYFLLTYLFSF